MKVKPCRDCGAPVFWHQSQTGAWLQYAAEPRQYDGSPGLALHRRRGLVDAGSVWPEPPDAFPLHHHPPRRQESGPLHVSAVLDDWLTQPKQKQSKRRSKRVVS